jgi:hypothetical protein
MIEVRLYPEKPWQESAEAFLTTGDGYRDSRT